MFKSLFNKTKTQKTEILVKKRKYPKVVEEIHNEFYSAGENILQEAKTLLGDLVQKDVAKGERLAAIGFEKTREAVAAKETKVKLITTKEIADLVVYYQLHYPNNKFITEDQVKSICEKYGLICGDIGMYKGFVPENKLEIIEQFKINDKDIPKYQIKLGRRNGNLSIYPANFENYINKERMNGAREFVEFVLPQFYNRNIGEFDEIVSFNKSFQICAPLKDMEIPRGKEVIGYKVQDISDPVVLQPCKGGYLIVTAWGDEASDELVVNQKFN